MASIDDKYVLLCLQLNVVIVNDLLLRLLFLDLLAFFGLVSDVLHIKFGLGEFEALLNFLADHFELRLFLGDDGLLLEDHGNILLILLIRILFSDVEFSHNTGRLLEAAIVDLNDIVLACNILLLLWRFEVECNLYLSVI